MTNAELVEKITKNAGISKSAATATLDSFLGNITAALKKRTARSR